MYLCDYILFNFFSTLSPFYPPVPSFMLPSAVLNIPRLK